MEGLGQAAHGVALQLGPQLMQASLSFAGDLDHILLALSYCSCRYAQPQQCNPAVYTCVRGIGEWTSGGSVSESVG